MIRAERNGAVALITIDRQDRSNALDAAACEDLANTVGEVTGADGRGVPAARALVLTGAGDHFCAGADLRGVEDASFAAALRTALSGLAESPVATIAAVHGAALGAGTQLAVACDLRVATADARFGIPAAKLGLMVDHWTVQRLARLAGYGPARAMLLAAEEVDGAAALRLGLVQRQGGLAEALNWAEAIAQLAPLTIAGHKLALNRLEQRVGDDPSVAAAFQRAWSSEDLAEGMAAFRERRPPVFRGC